MSRCYCNCDDCCHYKEDLDGIDHIADLERQLKGREQEFDNILKIKQTDWNKLDLAYQNAIHELQQQLQAANERADMEKGWKDSMSRGNKRLSEENAQLRQERDALLNHEWPRTLHGLEADNDTLRASLRKYGKHLDNCSRRLKGQPCDCNLQDLKQDGDKWG